MPWALRPHAKADTFEVVSQCFIDRVTCGEAVDWAEDYADTFALV